MTPRPTGRCIAAVQGGETWGMLVMVMIEVREVSVDAAECEEGGRAGERVKGWIFCLYMELARRERKI